MNNHFKTTDTPQSKNNFTNSNTVDVVLIGSGIMSATLGTFLSVLEPSWCIHIYEKLAQSSQESSNAWNNAGTGHAAFCELNYTEYDYQNDCVNIEKAISINTAFELSLQFWAYLIKKNILHHPKSFINNIPHISFVWGEKNISFLKKRFHALSKNILFNEMIYSEDPQEINAWIPLIMQGRNKYQKVAATRMDMGTDINFGEITQQLLIQLNKNPNFKIYLQHNVTKIKYYDHDRWTVKIVDTQNKQKKYINTRHVFIGGGGQSLNLLQTSNIPESVGYAGFPVGGQFLVTYNPKIIDQHFAKVYGKAPMNMPPMSVPHIDTRILNGHKVLLFGPFATFSSKFLKYGSWLDLFRSINKNNLIPMIQAGIDNTDLIRYLINQLMMSDKDRIDSLREYYPTANLKDWSLIQAGQRVQIIKKDFKKRGILQFGTEIVVSKNGSLSALLGASPGASTSAYISIKLLQAMFSKKIHSNSWKTTLSEIVPSYNQSNEDHYTLNSSKIRQNTRDTLKLTYTKVHPKNKNLSC